MQLEINGVNKIKMSPKTQTKMEAKLQNLDHFIPRHAQKSAHLRVILSESKNKAQRFVCEAILELPQQTITSQETAPSLLAAIDLLSSKLARQIKKYKTSHVEVKKDNCLKRLWQKARRRG